MDEYFERYQINKDGTILSLYRGDKKRRKKYKMTPQLRKDGYYQIGLCKADGASKIFLVHRLVALKFVDNPNGAPEVNHKNGDKSDNSAENLEWVTREQNQQHKYRCLGCSPSGRALPRTKVRCIETGEVFSSMIYASKKIDRSCSNIIQSIRTGCRCGGYHWERLTEILR